MSFTASSNRASTIDALITQKAGQEVLCRHLRHPHRDWEEKYPCKEWDKLMHKVKEGTTGRCEKESGKQGVGHEIKGEGGRCAKGKRERGKMDGKRKNRREKKSMG
jgi:hypothetical protein